MDLHILVSYEAKFRLEIVCKTKFLWDCQLWSNVTFCCDLDIPRRLRCTYNKADKQFFNVHQLQKLHYIGNLK